jgi:flagellar basal-body rod modification protein FlgD
MATIGSVTSATSGPTPSAQNPTTLGKDDFLKLLVTQLRFQDPLNPLDQNQFLAQTAQFTSLENLQNISAGIDGLRTLLAGNSLVDSAALVGRTVRASSREVAFDGRPLSLSFSLEAAVSSVNVDVIDASGNVVRRLVTASAGVGASSVAWDGLDAAGHSAPAGTYTYFVSSSSGTGPQPAAVSGVITGLSIVNGQPVYRIGDATVRPGEIFEIR